MRRPSILIFDESRSIRDMVTATLADLFIFDAATSASQALAELRRDLHIACVVQIPATAVAEHLQLLRHFHRQNPRRLLIALGDHRPSTLPTDCYDAGAHAFIGRSAHTMRELRAALTRLLRLPGFTPHKGDYVDGTHIPKQSFPFRSCTVQPLTMTLQFPNGHPAPISVKQLALLQLFADRPGQTVRRSEVLAHLWGHQAPTPKALDVQIMRLRKIFAAQGETLPLVARPKIGWQILA